MAVKEFEIKGYWVQLYDSRGQLSPYCAEITCYGLDRRNQRFTIHFYAQGSTPPANTSVIEENKIHGHLVVPSEQYAWYLDLLRNTGPIYAKVYDLNPSNNFIYTKEIPTILGDC